MIRDELIDDSIGITEILEAITIDCESKAIIIQGDFKQGKSYFLNCVKNKLIGNKISTRRIIELTTPTDIISCLEDFAQFKNYINSAENIKIEKISRKFKKLFENSKTTIKTILRLLEKENIFPTIYNKTECFILEKMNKILNHSGKVFFLCDDVDKWDPQSRGLLKKLIFFDRQNNWINKATFILTWTDTDSLNDFINENNQVSIFRLKNIDKNSLKKYLKKYNVNIDVDELFETSMGNIGVISELLDNNLSAKDYSNSLQQVLLQRLKIYLSDLDKSKQALDMVNKSSIIGYNFPMLFLQVMSQFKNDFFYEAVSAAKRGDIYKDNTNNIEFKSNRLWSILIKYNKNTISYHETYANTLKSIVPSNFYKRSQEYFFAENKKNAANCYFTYCIENYKKYHQEVSEDTILKQCLIEFDMLDDRDKLIKAYSYYFNEQFEEAKQCLCMDFNNLYVMFQKEYLEALIMINDTTFVSSYNEASVKLKTFVNDESFLSSEPYLWIQAAISKLEIDTELNNDIDKLTQKIIEVFRKYISNDKQFKFEYYYFLARNNYSHTIDITFGNTATALNYFKNEDIPSKSPYVCCLVNHQANTLILGNYDDVIMLTDNNLYLFNEYNELKTFLPALTNNYILANIFKDIKVLNNMSQKYIESFLKIIPIEGNYQINALLYKINLGLIYFFSGQEENAFNLYKELYDIYSENTNADDYYRYYIINNYSLIGMYLNKNISTDFISSLTQLTPLPNNKVFFQKRNELLKELIHQEFTKDLLFNPMGENILGKAWSFWGRPLLFTDIQYWTD